MIELARPWALWALLGLLPLWRWHRRARPAGDHPFTAFFLLPERGAEGGRGPRLRAPWLWAARTLAWLALVGAAAGPRFTARDGTLVLADGPVELDPAWVDPVVVVRAGQPPTVHDGDPNRLAPVAGPPDWGAALVVGRRLAPRARVVRALTRRPEPAILAAGAALEGHDVIVTAAVAAEAPVIRQGDRTWPMRRRVGDWSAQIRELAPGPAEVVAGAARWPLCIPDASPLAVADTGWPDAVEAVLGLLPVTRVPAEAAVWRPGAAKPRRAGWAAFTAAQTTVSFPDEALLDEGPAAVHFAGRLPPPGAEVRRWTRLRGPGEPLLHAGDAVLADRGEGPAGRDLRFGFLPRDSDLPETAGWPVLFQDLVQADRVARARCRRHVAGQALRLQATAPIRVRAPDGRQQTRTPIDGTVVLGGLDQLGHYRLISGDETAWVAVVPPPEVGSAVADDTQSPTVWAGEAPDHAAAVAGLGALLAGLILAGWRRRSRWAVMAALAAAVAAADVPVGGRVPGRLVVAVDRSGSMPAEASDDVLAALWAGLGGQPVQWVAGGSRVTGTGRPGDPLPAPDGDTRHGPLLAAAEALAGPGGAVALLTDGRAVDGPVAATLPIFPLPVQAAGPDAWIVEAQAVRIGERVFARAMAAADRPVTATVRLGEVAVDVRLGPEPRAVRASLAQAADELAVTVVTPGDREPRNDTWMVPTEAGAPRTALVVGAAASPWVKAAGLSPEVVPPAGLAEAGRRLAGAGAVVLHDQPAGRLEPAVLPRLRRWVEAGGLLLLAGRRQAFGPGGWAGTPLDQLSPLRADPRPPGVDGLAVLLALDRSGSMATEAGGIGPAGVGRLAQALADGLGASDRLGIVAFGEGVHPLAPLAAADRVRSGGVPVPKITRGGTRLGPLMREAERILARSGVEAPVLVVVSDGRFSDGDDPATREAAVATLRRLGARLVVVLVGPEPAEQAVRSLVEAVDGLLTRGGADEVPRLAVAGVLGGGRGGLVAPGSGVQPGDGWGSRLGGAPPPVGGRVRVAARPGARVLARAGGDPLLAEWSVGQGRVVALATDAWALDTAQWASLLAPAIAPRPRVAEVFIQGDLLHYQGDVGDPPPQGTAVLRSARGAREVAWQPTGPGAAVAPLPPGPAEVIEVATATARGALVTRVARPGPAELRATGVDPGALALQAALSGGQVLKGPQDLAPWRAGRRPAGGWPGPLVFGLLALLLLGWDARRWAAGG
ncbi:MAG: BatA domain-containing protein [Myxococcales bacterium]|nr:BatA domain-containing protein [Myxococcales bacterium]